MNVVSWPLASKNIYIHIVIEPFGNLDMVTCMLSSCNRECKKYIHADNAREGIRQYIEIDR